MKLYNIVIPIILFVFIGCKSGSGNANQKKLSINNDFLKQRFPREKEIIMLPCVRCYCFIEWINGLSVQEKQNLERYSIISDTTCNKFSMPSAHMPQDSIDLISFDFYNIVLIKKSDTTYKTRIIETDESKKSMTIIENFFR